MPRALLLAVLVLAAAAASADAIIGGRPASRPYPYMVSLQDGGDHFCGGSLVRPDWVLTAAHCIEGTTESQLSNMRAVIGRVDLSTQDGVEHEVDRYVVHEGYTGDVSDGDDIAILHLSTPSAQPPVKVAAPADAPLWEPGDTARVIGWGTSFFLVGPAPDDLYEVDVPIVSDDDCESAYPEYDPEEMVCAGEGTGTKDSCQGDSGGPLLAGDMSGDPVQVGTVSYGIGCGFPVFYGVYGRVGDETLRAWLDRNLPPLGSPAGTAPTAPTPAGQAGAPAPSGSGAAPAPATRLTLPKVLGSARKLRRRGAIVVRVRSSAPVTRLSATLERGGRAIGRATAASAGKLTFRVRKPAIRAGRLRLSVRATDASERPVSRTVTVRVRR
jgi:secreted trypsin-like serine protease